MTARKLVETIFSVYGYPEIITSDNHQTFRRTFFEQQPMQWETKLQFVVSAYNNSVNTVTMKSPLELVFGMTMPLPCSITGKKTPTYNYDDYAHDLRENVKYSWDLASQKLIERKIKKILTKNIIRKIWNLRSGI